MLSKRVCKVCHETHDCWTPFDDKRWDSRRVICPCIDFEDIFDDDDTHIDNPPPPKCRYALEHLMAAKRNTKPVEPSK